MEMHQIRYFLAVSEELNFTRAAERCNVAQPSLTRAIKLLEEELGGSLFHRERANTHLSELGRTVKPYLEEVYANTQEAKRQALDFGKLKKTPLKLGVMCTIQPDELVELVSGSQTRHPGIELEIIDASAADLEDRLLNGDLEVAIYCIPSRDSDERLHYMPLFREQFMIVVSPDHPLASLNTIHPRDLSGGRYLHRIRREVNLVTVRGRPHSPAVGALVKEAMRARWLGRPAIAVDAEKERAAAQSFSAAPSRGYSPTERCRPRGGQFSD